MTESIFRATIVEEKQILSFEEENARVYIKKNGEKRKKYIRTLYLSYKCF